VRRRKVQSRLLGHAVQKQLARENAHHAHHPHSPDHSSNSEANNEGRMLVAIPGPGSFISEMSFLRGFEVGWDDLEQDEQASDAKDQSSGFSSASAATEIEDFMLGESVSPLNEDDETNSVASDANTERAASETTAVAPAKPKRRGASATVKAATLDDLMLAWDLAIQVAEVSELAGLQALPSSGRGKVWG